jgi:DNA-binding IclR family transcriptional regulator
MPRYPTRSNEAVTTSEGGVIAVDRALTVLTSFRESDRPLNLSELSERTQLVPSTVLRLLASLIHFGFVQRRADGRYSLGPAIARLNNIYARSFNLQEVVLPVLQNLVEETKESASFHVEQGNHRLVLYRVDSPQPLSDQSRVGDLLPMDRGSGGHVLLAFRGKPGRTYDRIRKQGYAASPISDRSPELAGISAPVFDSAVGLVGAVTLTMPVHRYKEEHVKTVRDAAERLTRELGGSASSGNPSSIRAR